MRRSILILLLGVFIFLTISSMESPEADEKIEKISFESSVSKPPFICGISDSVAIVNASYVRGRKYSVTQNPDGSCTWRSGPAWVSDGTRYVPYIFENHYADWGFYLIRNGRIAVELYDGFARFFDPDHTQVRVDSEEWIVEEWAGGGWHDLGSYNPRFEIQKNHTSISITKTADTDRGTLTITYLLREGLPLKHTVEWQASEPVTVRVLQRWDNVYADGVNGQEIENNLTLEDYDFRFYTPDNELVVHESQWSTGYVDESGYHNTVLQPTEVRKHESGLSVDYIFSNWTLGSSESLRIDPDTFTKEGPLLWVQGRADGNLGPNCNATATTQADVTGTKDYIIYQRVNNTATSPSCIRSTVKWDITDIPDGATVSAITVTTDRYNHAGSKTVDVYNVTIDPATYTDQQAYDEPGNATHTIYGDNLAASWIGYDPEGFRSYTLLSAAHAEFEARLTADWFGIGITYSNEVRHATQQRSASGDDTVATGQPWKLVVTYIFYLTTQNTASNTITPNQDDAVLLYSQGNSSVGLDWAWVATNETGDWKNYTENVGWWNSSWKYRKKHTITGSSAGAQTNYQLNITIYNTTGTDSAAEVYIGTKAREDFGDIRFTNSTDDEFDYWIEEFGSNYAKFWVEVSTIPASPDTVGIYIYYGNSDVSNTSNGTNTFPLLFETFDDWDDWERFTDPSGADGQTLPTVSISNSIVTITGSSEGSQYQGIYHKTLSVNDQSNFSIRTRSRTNNVADDHAPIGWFVTLVNPPNTDINTAYRFVGKSSIERIHKVTPSSYTTLTSRTTDTTLANTWYIDEVFYKTDHTFKWLRNETQHLPTSGWQSDASFTSGSVAVGRDSDAYSSEFDWIFVRNYTDPEPSHGTWESEETINYTYPLSMNDAANEWVWSNFTWQNGSVSGVIGWRVYYNDTAGNENVTDIQSFTVIIHEALVASNATTAKRGDMVEFYFGDNSDGEPSVVANLTFPNTTGLNLTLTNNLVGWWRFNEAGGTTASDSSGSGNTGTLNDFDFNASSGWFNGTDCKYGGCLKFDGVDDDVTVTHSSSLLIDKITVSAWINYNATPDEYWQTIVEKNWVLDSSFWFGLNFTEGNRILMLGIKNDTGDRVDVYTPALDYGRWYYVAGTYDGSKIKAYINGTLINETNQTGLISNTDTLVIGAHNGPSSLFNGTIDNVKVFNRTLTASEIAQQYQIEAGYYYEANYTFTSYNPSGSHQINFTGADLTNSTNITMDPTITITLESTKMNSVRQIITRRNRDIHTNGTATYDSDGSAYASSTLNFEYDSTSLGTNTTENSGDYDLFFTIPNDGNYTFNVSSSDSFNNYGSNVTTITIKDRPTWVKYRMRYHLGTTKTNDIYRIGTEGKMEETIGSSTISNIQYASNLTKSYICSYDQTEYSDGLLLSLIHSYKGSDLEYVNFSATTETNYTLELKQNIERSSLILAYTEGTCQVVDDKYYLVEDQTLPSAPLASISFGAPSELPVQILVRYTNLELNGTGRYPSGSYQICLTKEGLSAGSKPIVEVKTC